MWPEGKPDGKLRALLLDSWFDEYRGVICLIEVRDGTIKVFFLLINFFFSHFK